MIKDLVKVFGETVIYGVTGVASTLISVFLVPFYTRVLTPGDYGVSALIWTLFSILTVVATAGLGMAIFRSYFAAADSERQDVIGTAFILQSLFPLIVSGLIFLLSAFLSSVLFDTNMYSYLIKLSAIALFFNVGITIPLALLRAEGSPTKFVVINMVKILFTVAFSIGLVVILRKGLNGVYWANLIGAFVGYLMGVGYTFRRLKPTFSFRWAAEMLKFGIPAVPTGLAIWVLNSSDRYFLNSFFGTADVGIYNVGYRVGMLVTLVSGALHLAYPRFMFSIYKERPDAKYYFAKINTYFYLITFLSALAISIFAKEAIQILTGPAFHSSYTVVPLIAFSYVFYGLFSNFGTGISVIGKTYLFVISTATAGLINLFFNFILISRFGVMGAALATFLSFSFLAIIQLLMAQRIYAIPYEFKRIGLVLLIGITLVIASNLINFDLLTSLFVKSIFFTLFPVVLYLFRFFEDRELKALRKIWLFFKSSRGNPKTLIELIRQDFVV